MSTLFYTLLIQYKYIINTLFIHYEYIINTLFLTGRRRAQPQKQSFLPVPPGMPGGRVKSLQAQAPRPHHSAQCRKEPWWWGGGGGGGGRGGGRRGGARGERGGGGGRIVCVRVQFLLLYLLSGLGGGPKANTAITNSILNFPVAAFAFLN